MDMKMIDNVLWKQKEFFNKGNTLSIKFRLEMLKKLKQAVVKYEKEILEALYLDLNKSEFEGYMCEIGMALNEISHMIKHIKKYSKVRKVKTPLAQFKSKSFVKPCPYGNTLIISPWNYPFLLSIDPLVASIASGNTAIIKPSEYSINTSKVIEKMINECFDEEYIKVVNGEVETSTYLLSQNFDFIFFTGSTKVGKIVLKSAAEHLIPTVLELGGKSPCIVDSSAKLKLAAKRIIFGKLINVGQTCVAPDYIYCQEEIKDELIKELIIQIKEQYGEDYLSCPYYGKIINKIHFERIINLINQDKVIYGGKFNKDLLKIEPTILDNIDFNDEVMLEEIFGPILPILTFKSVDEVINNLNNRPKPLAFYIFSEDKNNINKLMDRCLFGGGCINVTIIHLATNEMGFGGVKESGMGSYHGKVGFDAFSHNKSVVNKKPWLDLPMRYAPYKNKYLNLVKKFLK